MTDCNLWEDRDVRFDITLQWVLGDVLNVRLLETPPLTSQLMKINLLEVFFRLGKWSWDQARQVPKFYFFIIMKNFIFGDLRFRMRFKHQGLHFACALTRRRLWGVGSGEKNLRLYHPTLCDSELGQIMRIGSTASPVLVQYFCTCPSHQLR